MSVDLLGVRSSTGRAALDGDVLTAPDGLVEYADRGLDGQDVVAVPCMTSTGMSIFRRSARKSVCHLATHAMVPGRGADRGVPRVLDYLVADPGAEVLVQVEEVLVPLGGEGRPVAGQRARDLVEDLLWDAVWRRLRVEQVRGTPEMMTARRIRSCRTAPRYRAISSPPIECPAM